MIKIKLVFTFLLFFFVLSLKGQQVPFSPISYRVFSPYVLNPAMAGSKDFTTIDFINVVAGSWESQMLGGHTRLIKSKNYLNTLFRKPSFRNIGVGGYIFNEKADPFRNIGINAMFSYHIPLNRSHISYLAFGLSGKGILSVIQSEPSESDSSNNQATHSFTPDVDIGAYYYGSQLSVGLSVINGFNGAAFKDSIGVSRSPMSRQYSMLVAYKLLINRGNAIVIEPSMLLTTDGKLMGKFYQNIHPGIKVYTRNVYLGTYFNAWKGISIFMQYHFPDFYTGFYLEAPTDGSIAWRNKKLILELMIGIHLSGTKMEALKYRY